MKLSKAIRKGSEILPPCRGGYFEIGEGEMHACALGAAFYAVCKECSINDVEVNRILKEEWPELLKECVMPLTGKEVNLYRAIIRLNDSYCWDREKIAGWLEEQDL
jgi:hypothetical protein